MIMKCKITKKCMSCGFFSKISQTPKKNFRVACNCAGSVGNRKRTSFFLGPTQAPLTYLSKYLS